MRKRIQRRPVASVQGEGRIRRDRRAERDGDAGPADAAVSTAAATVRRNPRQSRGRERVRQSGVDVPETWPASVPLKTIEEPQCFILAVPDISGGRLSGHDLELLGVARALADALNGAVAVVAIAINADVEWGDAGVDRLVVLDDPIFEGYCPEVRTSAVLSVIEHLNPKHILFPETLTEGGDVGRRVAAKIGERPAGNVIRVNAERIVRRGKGESNEFILPIPRILMLAPGSADPVIGVRHEARRLEAGDYKKQHRLIDGGLRSVGASEMSLEEAPFIVAAGNGVTDWTSFHRLAVALGATEGASRVVCDEGHLPRDRQIGASGTLADSDCYLALGISGAPQHLQGITRCRNVIAVNTDIHADIVKRADLAIIADVQEVMPVLAQLVETARAD